MWTRSFLPQTTSSPPATTLYGKMDRKTRIENSPQTTFLCHFCPYRSLMFPFSNYIPIVTLPLFARHHNFSSFYFFFSFFLLLFFALFFPIFSPIVNPPISSTLFSLVFFSPFSLLHSPVFSYLFSLSFSSRPTPPLSDDTTINSFGKKLFFKVN